MACKYLSKNGKSSILFDEVYKTFGEETARRTFLAVQTPSFTSTYKEFDKDENGDPTKQWLISNNLIAYGKNIKPVVNISVKDMEETITKMQKVFSDIGVEVDTIIDTDMKNSGKLIYENNKPVIKINPFKIKEDTIYNEFGHVYVDMLGLDNNAVKDLLIELKDTKLWKDVSNLYPELTKEQLHKEIATTAIGMEAVKFANLKNGNQILFAINRIIRRIGELLGIDVSKSKLLAENLINGKIDKNLAISVQLYEQRQKDLAIVNNVFRTKETLVKKLQESLLSKINSFYKGLTEKQKAADTNYQELLVLQELLETYAKNDSVLAITSYIKEAYIQTGKIERFLDNILNSEIDDYTLIRDKVTGTKLKSMIEYNSTFSLIQEIIDTINHEPELMKRIEDEKLLGHIFEIQRRYIKIKENNNRLSIMLLSEHYGSTQGRVEGGRRIELERKFNADNAIQRKTLDKTQFKVLRQQYIDEQIKQEKQHIRYKEIQRFERLFRQANDDISALDRFFIDGDALNDDLIQSVIEELDRADYIIMQETQEQYKVTHGYVEELDKTNTKTSQLEKYNLMIEDSMEYDEATDSIIKGKTKNRQMTSKYYSLYYKIKDEKWKEFDKVVEEFGDGSLEAEAAYAKVLDWTKRNTRKTKKDGKVVYVPIGRWENPAYDEILNNSQYKEFYFHMIELALNSSERLPQWARLIRKVDGEYQIKLPTVKKSSLEQAYQDGIGNTMLDKLKRFSKYVNIFKPSGIVKAFKEYGDYLSAQSEFGSNLNPEDYQNTPAELLARMSSTLTNDEGKEKQRVPINYRYELPIDEQSWDIPTIMLLDDFMSRNYATKRDLVTTLELTRDLVGQRQVVQTKPRGLKGVYRKVNSLLSQGNDVFVPVTKSGVESNAYKALNSIIEDRLYGISSVSGVGVTKVTQWISSYTGNSMLILNYLSAAANLGSGLIYDTLGGVGGNFYDKKNLTNAIAAYTNDLAHGTNFSDSIINDFGKKIAQSKTNVLLQTFNIQGDWSAVSGKFMDNTRIKELFKTEHLHFLNKGGEHMIQGIFMYAMLDNIKVLNSEGEYLTKDGTTTDIKKAMSLHEAFYVDNGRLKIDNRVSKTTDNDFPISNYGGVASNESLFLTARKIKDLNAYLQGQYDRKKRAEIQRHWYGTLALLMRKWLPRGFKYHWRGIGTILEKQENLLEDETFYSRALRTEQEGYYTTFARFNINLIRALKSEQFNVAANWNNMTDYEKGNVKRAIYELGLMITLFTLGIALKKLAEDDDKEHKGLYSFIAFECFRLQKELANFINPVEFSSTVKTPTVAIQSFDKLIKLLIQVGIDPTEVYKRGRNKGESKVFNQTMQLFPAVRYLDKAFNFEESTHESLNFIANKRL